MAPFCWNQISLKQFHPIRPQNISWDRSNRFVISAYVILKKSDDFLTRIQHHTVTCSCKDFSSISRGVFSNKNRQFWSSIQPKTSFIPEDAFHQNCDRFQVALELNQQTHYVYETLVVSEFKTFMSVSKMFCLNSADCRFLKDLILESNERETDQLLSSSTPGLTQATFSSILTLRCFVGVSVSWRPKSRLNFSITRRIANTVAQMCEPLFYEGLSVH